MACLLALLWSCSGLRTEFYREETLHRYQGACKLYREGAYRAARSAFEAVVALDPDYGPAHAALGNLALIGEDYPSAAAHYQAALSADPALEAELQALVLVAAAHQARAPLQEAGVGLNQVYPMIMGERRDEVEALLQQEIPLRLLASDTMGITPGRLAEMQRKTAQTADPLNGSARYRLFLGYLLFYGQTDDDLAAALIGSAAAEAVEEDRQEAFVVLGRLHERRGKTNAAVDAYLAAVDAGLPMTAVAHHLARVYRVDIAQILPPKTSPPETVPPEPMQIGVATHLPPPQAREGESPEVIHAITTGGSGGTPHTF